MTDQTYPLTIIILTLNAADTLQNTLDSLTWAQEILIIDSGSTDNTLQLAKQSGAKVISTKESSFAQRRNRGLKEATNDWVLYIDSDEVPDQRLINHIQQIVGNTAPPTTYQLKRQNIHLGTPMGHEWLPRLFHNQTFNGWQGKLHETPLYQGEVKQLSGILHHYTHRDIRSMLKKTNNWSQIEAELRVKANHPPVKPWRMWRIALTETWHQLARKHIWRYGRAGIFEGYFQIIDKLIVYTKLWEQQQSNSNNQTTTNAPDQPKPFQNQPKSS